MMLNRKLAIIALAAISTASCGGGHGSTGSALPQRSVKTTSVQLSIVIPLLRPASAARRPKFVSSGTLSGSLTITSPSYSVQAFGLAPDSPNCSSNGTSRTCTVGVDMPIGNDTLTVSTFDGPLTSGGATSGHVLGSASATQQIVEATANHVVVSLLGVPATVTITAQQSTIASNGTSVTVPLTVAVYDASGNQITGSDPFTFPIDFQMQSATSTFGSNFRFSVNGGAPGGGQITSPTDTIALVYAGRDGSGTYTLGATSNYDGHLLGSSATINVVPGFHQAQQVFSNLAKADIVQRYDTADVWFTEPAAKKIATFSANNVFTEFPVVSGKEPRHILYTGINGVFPGAGSPFIVTELPDTIGILHTNGSITEHTVPTSNPGLGGIAFDYVNLRVWFAERTAAKIGVMSLGGSFTEYPVNVTGSSPAAVAQGPSSGTVWFTDPGTNSIGLLRADHSVVEFPVPTANAAPSLMLGSYFAESNAPNLGSIDSAGHVTEYPAGDVIVSLFPGATDGFTTLWAITRNGTIEHFDASGHYTVVANTLPSGGTPFVGTIGTNANAWFLRRGVSVSDLNELFY